MLPTSKRCHEKQGYTSKGTLLTNSGSHDLPAASSSIGVGDFGLRLLKGFRVGMFCLCVGTPNTPGAHGGQKNLAVDLLKLELQIPSPGCYFFGELM